MKQYLDTVKHIMENGNDRNDRTGTGTRGVFGYQTRYDLKDTFPLITHRRAPWKGIVGELVWFLSGSVNNNELNELNCKFWNEFADEEGSIGPMYGAAWRGNNPYHVDQMAVILKQLNDDPWSRRIVLDSWAPDYLPFNGVAPKDNPKYGQMALAPCHPLSQYYVEKDELSILFYMRASDFLIGAPANIASYALLTLILAQLTGYKAKELIYTAGDMHIYKNHIETGAVDKILAASTYPLPTVDLSNLFLEEVKEIQSFTKDTPVNEYSCILDELFIVRKHETYAKLVDSLKNYKCGKSIEMAISV